MNRILGRPGRLLLPLAIAACHALGCEKAAGLMLAIIASRLLSLCAGAALRRASTRVVSGARLTGNYYLALIMSVIGGGVTCLLAGKTGYGMETALAGALINLAQTASDGLYAIPDSISGNACDALIALFAAAGLMVSGDNNLLLICACGICLIAAVVLSLALRRRRGFSLGFQVIKSSPMALLRVGLPIAASSVLADYTGTGNAAIFWAVFEAMEAPIRRNETEAHWLNIVCALTGTAGAALAMATSEMSFVMSAFAAVFFLMIFCAPIKWREGYLLIAIALALAATYFSPIRTIGAPLCGHALAVAIPDFKNAYIRLKAQRKMRRRR